MNRTLKCPEGAILIEAILLQSFWPDAIEHATQIYNMLSFSSNGMTPHEKLTGTKPFPKD